MADIFISYSKADRLLVEQLAAFLQAEGWSVWWDTSLAAGDAYRDEIIRELVAARAVIAVWTATSVGSDWVRAEAGRAKAAGKLIPVKAADVGYADIPLPFGEMHTEPVENHAQIRAAIAAELVKPVVVAPWLLRWASTARYEALTWFGIIGAAITLFTGLKGLVQLSEWARLLVENWQAWTQAAWTWAFAWFRIKLPPEFVGVLTFLSFAASTLIGTWRSMRSQESLTHQAAQLPGLRIRKPWLIFLLWIGGLLCGMLAVVGLVSVIEPILAALGIDPQSERGQAIMKSFPNSIVGPLLSLGLILPALYFCRDRLAVLGFAVMYGVLIVLLPRAPIGQPSEAWIAGSAEVIDLISGTGFTLVALALLPARRLNRRFVTILIGFCLLLGLNWLATLDVARYLPK